MPNEWGTNKIKSVSICLGNTFLHGELKIQNFHFISLLYERFDFPEVESEEGWRLWWKGTGGQ